MVMLSEEMKRMIAEVRLCYVATVTPDGRPNLSPKGSLKVLDDDHVVFADIASPQTVENVRTNPFMEINVVDPFRRRGYRFKGKAEIITDEVVVGVARRDLGRDYPVRCAVTMRVEEALPLVSPVYTYGRLSEEEVRAMWLRRYRVRTLE